VLQIREKKCTIHKKIRGEEEIPMTMALGIKNLGHDLEFYAKNNLESECK